METTISPSVLPKNKTYEQFQSKALTWTKITDFSKEKQAIVSLPEDDENQIREKVFDEVKLQDR